MKKKTKKEWEIVYAEHGFDFQEYEDNGGKIIPAGTPIGIEGERGIFLLSGVWYSSKKTEYWGKECKCDTCKPDKLKEAAKVLKKALRNV